MRSEWASFKLGDLTIWSSGGTPSKANVDFWGGDIPWISASSMGGIIYSESKLKITTKGLNAGSRLAPKDSILLLVRGSILHQKIQVGIAGRDLAFNQDVKCLIIKNELIEPWYLLLWFMANKKHLLGKVENTGIGAGKLDTKLMQELVVEIPPKTDRQVITNFGKAICDKIELNRQSNQTLERIAQAIFKSWFVDFDPVIDKALAAGKPIPDELKDRAQRRHQQLAKPDHKPLPADILQLFPSEFELTEELGWVPLGWKVNVVENILIRLKAGKRYSKKEVSSFGQVPVYEQGQDILLGYHNDEADFRASMEEPIFIFGDHTCVTKLSVEPFSISANVIPLKGKIRNTYWTYFAVKDLQSFEEYRRHWMEFAIKSVIIPSVEVADLFSHTIGTNAQKSKELVKSSNTLTRLRDTLLPKLISGELRLPPEALCGEDQKLS